jgi:DnaJ homolog subfamily A member 2
LANHPDKVPETQREEAHARFQQAQDAYDILKDPEQRAIYDERGLEGVKNGAGPGGPGAHQFADEAEFASFINNMFGEGGPMGGMGAGRRSGRKSKDAIQEFEVSLEELYNGKHVKLMSKRKVVCSHCKGYKHPSQGTI